MSKDELIKKAIFIQYPKNGTKYVNYEHISKNVYKLPLVDKKMMYDKWYLNSNHYTTEYHRLYSLPLVFKLLNIDFDVNDFTILERNFETFDISIYYPKVEQHFEIYGFSRDGGEHFDDITYNDLIHNDSKKDDITEYHRLYKYSHECSRIINKAPFNNSERKLLISGDSQMIPDIAILACYFKELWYLDKRSNIQLQNKWSEIEFSDVLIELNCASEEQYIINNFK